MKLLTATPRKTVPHFERRHALVGSDQATQIAHMAPRIFDFSHLTPAERIELAEQLWDSLEMEPDALDDSLAAELRTRREELRSDGLLGDDGDQALDEIATRDR
jgi:putative addiction module component (TIGR02574 family)